MPITVLIDATVPVEELEAFLQLLRAWDGARTDRHMNITVKAPELSADQLNAILSRLKPPLDFRAEIRR